MGPWMNEFINKINNCNTNLTKSQKIVSQFYVSNLDSAAFYNLEEAAAKAGVSTTTIIRFARSLGYNGFSEMQRAIQHTLINKVRLPERLTSLEANLKAENSLLSRSMEIDLENITKTFAGINPDTLDLVCDKIISAETVYILGLRSSFALSHYLTSRLAQIRPRVRMIEASGMLFPEDFGGCSEKDLCVAFLFPRFTKTTSNLLLWIRKNHVPVVLFTSTHYESLSNYGDIFVPCYIKSASFKNSFVAPISLINFISAEVATKNSSCAEDTMKKTEEFLNMGYYLGL